MNPIVRPLCLIAVTILSAMPHGARADDPINGAAVFTASCNASGCHSTSTPLSNNSSKIFNARNARSWIQNNINSNNSGMGRLSGLTAQQVADVAAYLGTSTGSPAATLGPLSFPTTAVGTTSATTKTVTVAASLKSGYAISGLSVAASGDFARSGGTCGTTVATGTTCTVVVSFAPTGSGTRSGTLSISHAGTLTPIVTALTGTGSGGSAAAVANITPTSLAFPSTPIGGTSAAQSINIANPGSAALAISALSLTNTADFVIAGGTCAAGSSVPPGANCTASIAFTPSAGATGTRSGALSIAHNAAGSPGSVALSGSAGAAAAPAASLTSALAFGSVGVGTTSSAQTAVLSNTGAAALVLGTLSTGSTEFVISGGSCAAGGSVAPGSSCTVQLSLTPAASGTRSASLVVTHNAAGGQSSATLSGSGVALNPVLGLSPTALTFSQTVGTVSAAQTVVVSNTGNAPLSFSALTMGGAQAAEFQIASGTTCTTAAPVAASSSCVLKLSFAPTAVGARNASLTIAHNAAGSPTVIALGGSGTTTPQPAIALNAASLTFAPQTVGSTGGPQTVSVGNSGSATLTLGALTLNGSAAADFTRGGTCTAGLTLVAGASCTLSIGFTPGALGARTATLTLASDASNGSAALSLAGTGAAVAAAGVTLAPGSLAFGNQAVGSTSTVRTATLTNSGSGALSISGIAASAGFGVSHDCGTSLAAASTCTLSASFTPGAIGAASGTISVTSNAAGSPHAVALTGAGVQASPVLAWLPATTALGFADASVGGSASTASLTLANLGPGSAMLQQFTVAGPASADFSVAPGGSCALNATLAAGASCTLALAFQPAAAGARSATLQVLSSGTNPPDVVLSGNGSAAAGPAVAFTPTALSFAAATAAPAAAQTLTVQSTGSAVLRVTAMRVAAGAFSIDTASANGCSATPFDLMPGQSCSLAVGWMDTATASEAGLIEIDTNAAAAPSQVALQATRTVTLAGATSALPNAGGGGCSIARGATLTDPMLLALALLAVVVLCLRKTRSQKGNP